jgi:hypothetical protein
MLQTTGNNEGEYEAAWRAAPDVTPEPKEEDWGIDPTAEALASGTKLAGGVGFQSEAVKKGLEKEGYLDATPKDVPAPATPSYSTGKSDRQLRDIANAEKNSLQLEELWKKSRPELNPTQRRAEARKANGLPP